MVDEQLVKDRVLGRKIATEVYDYIISELEGHSDVVANTFFDELQNKLIAIRPPSELEPEPAPLNLLPIREPYLIPREWKFHEIPSGYILIDFDGECKHVTGKAALISNIDDGGIPRDIWIPFSCMFTRLVIGDKVGAWPLSRSFCDKNGW